MAVVGESKIVNAEEYDTGSNGSGEAGRMHASALGGTAHDAEDMQRMGKKQELRVSPYCDVYAGTLLSVQLEKFSPDFHHWVRGCPTVNMGKCSTVSSCSCVDLSPAKYKQSSAYFGLFNGGTAGVIWMMIITWMFVLAMIASLAEMASMAPTAGGQYHWVSEFAPPSFQKSLSYIVGM